MTLRPRTFAIVLLLAGFAILGATMAANFLLDPQMIFGTLVQGNVSTANYRYHRVKQYQAVRHEVDSLLFSSSRGRAFDPTLLAQRLGTTMLQRFDVPFGMITDHVPALEYVLRDKASRGEHIRAVFLLLDADFFGEIPRTNTNTDAFLPPEETGEAPARFWWKSLTVFQFKIWREKVRALLTRSADAAEQRTPPRIRLAFADKGTPPADTAVPPLAPDVAEQIPQRSAFASRPQMNAQLDLVARVAALCRANGIRLTVALSPLHVATASQYEAHDLQNVVRRINAVVPVWDFTMTGPMLTDPAEWDDRLHFRKGIADRIINRIFEPAGAAPNDFGVFRDGRPGAVSLNR